MMMARSGVPKIDLPAPAHGHLSLGTFSPVNQNGSFEFDRILKFGDTKKRNRRTETWKPVRLVLRPNLLSIYRDQDETLLRHKVYLSEVTAVTPRRDRKAKSEQHSCRFGIFTPSRNFHLEAATADEAHGWISMLRKEARLKDDQDDVVVTTPEGTSNVIVTERGRRVYRPSTSDAIEEEFESASSLDLPGPSFATSSRNSQSGSRQLGTSPSSYHTGSILDAGSLSDASETIVFGSARKEPAFPLTGRSSMEKSSPLAKPLSEMNTAYARSAPRSAQGLGSLSGSLPSGAENTQNEERVVREGWMRCLRTIHGVKQWKQYWVVLRQKRLTLYKTPDEYAAVLIVPTSAIQDAGQTDPASKNKQHCLQIITEEKSYRFSVDTNEAVTHWLDGLMSVLGRKR